MSYGSNVCVNPIKCELHNKLYGYMVDNGIYRKPEYWNEPGYWDIIKTIKQSLRNDINQSKRENRGKVPAGKKQKLLTWLNSMSLQDILSWFDAIEMTEVSSQIKARRWNTEVLERDKIFLQMLGIEINT